MMRICFRLTASLALLMVSVTTLADVDIARLKLFQPLPDAMTSDSNPMTPAKVELGRMLYYDMRLSKNHDVACNSCHLLDQYGVDGKPVSTGHRQQKGNRNAPTVYNAAGHFVQFWDGRAADVEEQAKGPVLNPVEMAMPDEASVVAVLKSIPGYVEAFSAAYPDEADPVTYDNMARAIGAFERGLVTPGRWDRFLAGDRSALTAAEQDGLATFMEVGCYTCHSGTYVGGMMLQKLGLMKPWPKDNDLGRYEVTGKEYDKFFFKVPSLRNVAETAPYFHDGSVKSLQQAVRLMGEYQLGKTLNDEQVDSIVTFLKSLTGTVPADYVAKPALPASGPNTPPPDPS
ncbi:MAG TPA: cytochrome-c peroxidase [Chromatiales bacterium]|nr:cytochrome-c peroxidase [Chromatiales bacterium]